VRGWWGALPFVSRREYLRAVDLVTDANRRYQSLHERTMRLASERANNTLDTTAAIQEINQVKVALGHVAVYEGLVESSPVAMLVDELVRDHEELESRIDAVVHHIAGAKEFWESRVPLSEVDRILELLKGGARVPDTIEGIDGA